MGEESIRLETGPSRPTTSLKPFFEDPQPYLLTARNLLRLGGYRREAALLEAARTELRLRLPELGGTLSTEVRKHEYSLVLILPSRLYARHASNRRKLEARLFQTIADAIRSQPSPDRLGERSVLSEVTLCVLDDEENGPRSGFMGTVRRTGRVTLDGIEWFGGQILRGASALFEWLGGLLRGSRGR